MQDIKVLIRGSLWGTLGRIILEVRRIIIIITIKVMVLTILARIAIMRLSMVVSKREEALSGQLDSSGRSLLSLRYRDSHLRILILRRSALFSDQ